MKAGDDKSHIECLLYLLSALSDPDPIYSRFDQTVGNRTVRGPGQAAAAVMRLPNSRRGFALTLTGDGNLCAADPYAGAQAALAESVRRAVRAAVNEEWGKKPLVHALVIEV